MLHIELENIVSESEATARIGELISRVDGSDQIVVVTRNNQPAVALIAVSQLEGLTGRQVLPAAPKGEVPNPVPTQLENTVPEPATAAPATLEAPTPMATPEVTPVAPELTPLPPLPDLPDFPGNDVLPGETQTPASPVPFSNPAPTLPVPPATPAFPTPPAVPSMPGSTTPPTPAAPAAPVAPAPYSVPPADLPAFARNQQDGGGLPPEDLNSSSPLA